MQNQPYTPEQEKLIEQMCVLARLSKAATELAEFCHASECTIEEALPLFLAVTERKLAELKQ